MKPHVMRRKLRRLRRVRDARATMDQRDNDRHRITVALCLAMLRAPRRDPAAAMSDHACISSSSSENAGGFGKRERRGEFLNKKGCDLLEAVNGQP
jgi:hypothetical protein